MRVAFWAKAVYAAIGLAALQEGNFPAESVAMGRKRICYVCNQKVGFIEIVSA